MGNNNLEEQDKKQLRMAVVDEMLDVIGKGLPAQSIGPANHVTRSAILSGLE